MNYLLFHFTKIVVYFILISNFQIVLLQEEIDSSQQTKISTQTSNEQNENNDLQSSLNFKTENLESCGCNSFQRFSSNLENIQLEEKKIDSSSSNQHEENLMQMKLIPGGEYWIGSDAGLSYRGDGEGPRRRVVIDRFLLDEMEVTNQMFSKFVEVNKTKQKKKKAGIYYD